MPAGDGTGPLGLGSVTGRAAGYCAGFPFPGYLNPIVGRAFGPVLLPAVYASAPYAGTMVPYSYPTVYPPIWPRAVGWFAREFGRGWGRGFGRGGGRGRRWFGW
jgi:hypothetical protein